jgi:SHS2 domain-containing protein
MQRYKEFEHTADIGVEIYGTTPDELFLNAGYAFFNTIAEVSTILPQIERSVCLSGDDIESLFMNWLRELLYLFSVHQEIYAEFEIQSFQPTQLEIKMRGEAFDVEKHHFNTEIKAVTYHQFSVVNEDNLWKARVIFDV